MELMSITNAARTTTTATIMLIMYTLANLVLTSKINKTMVSLCDDRVANMKIITVVTMRTKHTTKTPLNIKTQLQ